MSENNNTKALKSGVWYTVANFITKSIGFITTPIFTRLLSQNDFGLFSNYSSWSGTFAIFATMGLTASFISARFEYEKDFDGYVSSMLALSTLITCAWAVAINLLPDVFVDLTGLQIEYINIMIVYTIFSSAIDIYQTRERYFYGYKASVISSLVVVFSTALLSVVLVVTMTDKLTGRIVGSALPTVLVGLFLTGVLLKRGKKVSVAYWAYALPICLPFVPHVLSLSLLSSMDKMIVTKICGPEDNALYSVAYSCGALITLLLTSMNTAFAPWLGEKLNTKEYSEIRRVSKWYVLAFAYFACGVMLASPEVLIIMGGESYCGAMYVMPPVAFGCVCQFIYTMYVNVEQFKKKTVGMAFASIAAAASNFVLNWLLVPQFGYVAAAYTTLASYMILLALHVFIVWRLGYAHVYSTKLVLAVLVGMSVYTLAMYLVYDNPITRYAALATFIAVTLALVYRYRKVVLHLVKSVVNK